MSFSVRKLRAMGVDVPPAKRKPKVKGPGLLPDRRDGDPVAWTVIVPGKLVSLNALVNAHRMAASWIKKTEAETIAKACLVFGVTRATGKRTVQITRVMSGHDKPYDADNIPKSIHDALVHCGALVDDGPKWVETLPPAQIRGERTETHITIAEVEQ